MTTAAALAFGGAAALAEAMSDATGKLRFDRVPAGAVPARTGASLLGPGLLGGLLVAFGAGALTASRNREAGSRGRA
jgi:hypothetical protein